MKDKIGEIKERKIWRNVFFSQHYYNNSNLKAVLKFFPEDLFYGWCDKFIC